jgi:Family of unknown function (DUF6228)
MGGGDVTRTVEFRPDEAAEPVIRLTYEPADPDFGTLVVDVRAEGLSCDVGVVTARGDGLDDFMASLAADWRGWDGLRSWDALENGMTIEATHRRSRVELLFIVRRDYKRDAWQVRLPVLIAPGESLSELAKAIASLFEVERDR